MSKDYQDLAGSDAISAPLCFSHTLDLDPMESNILLSTNNVAYLYGFFDGRPCYKPTLNMLYCDIELDIGMDFNVNSTCVHNLYGPHQS